MDEKNGTVIKNDLYPLIDNLDAIPAADFTNEDKYLVERGKTLELPVLADRAEYDIMSSRGCPFACTYCCNNTYVKIYKGLGQIVRRRKVENVIDELKNAKKIFKSLSYVYFYDDVFTTDKGWIEQFSRQYSKEINLPFFCYTHPACADGDTFRLLKEAGLRDITMGIQTGSKSTREVYLKRPGSNDKIMELAHLFKRQRINVSYDILMDNPFESDEDKNQTLRLLLSLPRPFQLHTHSLTYFPETELTRLALENGYISEADVEDQKQKSLKTWTATLDLSRSKADLFWDNLYYMAKKRYFPRRFIIRLSQSRFFKENPRCLAFLLKTFTYDIHSVSTGRFKIVYLVFNGLKMLFCGEFSRFKSHLKMYLKRNFD